LQKHNWFQDIDHLELNPLFLVELPAVVLLSIYYHAHFRGNVMPYMFALYMVKEVIGMSACLHRYFAHRGFKCSRFVQFLLYLGGSLASQGSPIWWASMHRKHHSKCDTDGDPHSPVVKGFWMAWLGWVYVPGNEGALGAGTDRRLVRDLLAFPELAVMENLHFFVVLAAHYAFYLKGGITWALFVSAWSGVICQVATLYFNAAFHMPDSEESRHPGDCQARDIPLDPLSNLMGEAYHLWHHQHPKAFHRPGLDLPYYCFILPMLKLGVFQGKNAL
jgi:stearoyl-CoA desaturase (delta-9 desaturase)